MEGWKKNSHPSLEEVRAVRRAMASGSPRIGKIAPKEIVDRSRMRKLDDGGFPIEFQSR